MYGTGSRVKHRIAHRAAIAGAAAVALVAVASGCRTVPFRAVVESSLPVAWKGASVHDVDEAIWRAGRKDSWEVERLAPGRLRGTRRWKRHVVVVSITHDDRRLRIAYDGSENLRHEGDEIHRAYDTLLERLVARIEREPIVPRAAGTARRTRP